MISASDSPRRRSWPRRLLNRLEVGQAVFYAILLRVWQLLGGLVTVTLIVRMFSQEMQDMYYAFASVVALQTFFELGLSILIVNQCSHEWSRLDVAQDGRIVGDADAKSRLISFGRLLFGWYGGAGLLFVVAITTGGTAFLAGHSPGVSWRAPWMTVSILSGFLLWTLPFNSLLEGCNQVASVNRFRLIQTIAANTAVWTTMWLGGGLWAASASVGARLLCDVVFLFGWYGRFFRPFWARGRGAYVSWRREIWPLQWRLAVGSIFGYFASFLFVPVMFWYQPPGVAGRMGLTWSVVTAIQAAALAWVQTRAPHFGILVSKGERSELDRIFLRVGSLGVAAYLVAAGLFAACVWQVNVWHFQVAERLLDPVATLLFLTAALVQIVTSSLAFYVRAHKREPFLWVGVASNVAVGLSVWQLGKNFGPIGAGAGLLLSNLLITLPTHVILWLRCRADFA